jgi:diacylglycerol kinase family enzyme
MMSDVENPRSGTSLVAELRDVLAARGVTEPLWLEVPKSRMVPARIREAVDAGAELVFVWGGDGSVQRAVDALASMRAKREKAHAEGSAKSAGKKSKNANGSAPSTEVSRVRIAILPAGTANLLASNLGIPKDLEQAVDVGLGGADRVLDVGRMNGEHFAVMGGMGLDSLMIKDADSGLKDRFGRAAYVWTGARAVRRAPTRMTIHVDDHIWFDGDASCVLVGNVGDILGGISAFERAKTDDGLLDLAVITADGALQWARTLARAAFGHADRAKLVRTTVARKIRVATDKPLPYEMDGGARKKTTKLSIRVVPAAITVKVPAR